MAQHRSTPPPGCDIAVIGAGLVGLATARALRRRHPGAEIAIIERESGPAQHQSGHSSGVIHAGIYYRPGSLKARLCVEGAAALYDYCAERGIPTRRSGKLIVAAAPSELTRLDELERRGRANSVPGLERLGADRIREIEPHAAGIAALHSPATGVVDFGGVAEALAAELIQGGVSISWGCEVSSISERGSAALISHRHGGTRAARLVSCAGLWADRLAVSAGADPDPRIVPFRGSYLRLRASRADLVRGNIYPVPDPDLPFLGAHLTRRLDGSVLLGPTSLPVGARDAYRALRVRPRDLAESLAWPGTWRMLRRFRRYGAGQLHQAVRPPALVAECRRLVPSLSDSDVERSSHSGIRAQAIRRDGSLVDDFVISRTARGVHLRNAPSPAATAALALAEEIADRVDSLAAG